MLSLLGVSLKLASCQPLRFRGCPHAISDGDALTLPLHHGASTSGDFGGLNTEEFVRSGYEYDSDVGSTRGQLVTNLPLNCPFYHLSKCGRQVELQPCLRRSGEVRCELANIRQKVCREVVKMPKKAGFLVVFLPAGTLYYNTSTLRHHSIARACALREESK